MFKLGKDHWNYKHGYNNHKLYRLFMTIKRRCYNKNKENYNNYGGRGIKICEKWLNNPEIFINWALNNGYKPGLQIDRINNDGDYSPENCRFISCRDNILNSRLLNCTNSSGYCGVYYNKSRNKWRSSIKIHGKSFNLGDFDRPRLAALRRDVEAFIHGYKLNFE